LFFNQTKRSATNFIDLKKREEKFEQFELILLVIEKIHHIDVELAGHVH